MAVLTVSRQHGSGSNAVVQEIRTSLHYELVDKQVLLNDIRASGMKWAAWARELDHITPSFWEKYDRSFRGFGALLQSILLNYALQDDVILKGRGANFLLEGIPHAFRIRFVDSLDNRIERISMRDAVDEETARLIIERTDAGKAGFVYALYGKDWSDAKYYDAVFETGHQSVSEMADVVKQTLMAKNDLKTDETRRLLFMRAVSAKIKARLITDPRLYVPVLDVSCTEGEIVLRGIVRSPDQFHRIVDAARELAGECPLKVELRYRV